VAVSFFARGLWLGWLFDVRLAAALLPARVLLLLATVFSVVFLRVAGLLVEVRFDRPRAALEAAALEFKTYPVY